MRLGLRLRDRHKTDEQKNRTHAPAVEAGSCNEYHNRNEWKIIVSGHSLSNGRCAALRMRRPDAVSGTRAPSFVFAAGDLEHGLRPRPCNGWMCEWSIQCGTVRRLQCVMQWQRLRAWNPTTGWQWRPIDFWIMRQRCLPKSSEIWLTFVRFCACAMTSEPINAERRSDSPDFRARRNLKRTLTGKQKQIKTTGPRISVSVLWQVEDMTIAVFTLHTTSYNTVRCRTMSCAVWVNTA